MAVMLNFVVMPGKFNVSGICTSGNDAVSGLAHLKESRLHSASPGRNTKFACDRYWSDC
jgi:hypothetical protein